MMNDLHNKPCRGFTLIEIMISVVIISFGLTGILYSYNLYIGALDTASASVSADRLMSEEMQRVAWLLEDDAEQRPSAEMRTEHQVGPNRWRLITSLAPAQRLPHDIFYDVRVRAQRDGYDKEYELVTILYIHDES